MSNFTPAKCKSCGADVIFVELEGKRLILNKRRERVYRKERQELGGMFRLMVGNGREPMLLHISHFSTCPNASQHSKGKGKPRR